MKKVIIFLALVALSGLVLPKFIGSVVETEHQNIIDKMKGNPSFSMSKKSFERHWFGGEAITEMTIHLQGTELEDFVFTINESLSFGPFIFADDGFHFALSYSTAKFNFEQSEIIDEEIVAFIREHIHVTELMTLSKDFVSRIVIDEISKEVDGNSLVSQQAVGEFTLSDKKRLVASFNWGGLTIKGSSENVEVGAVSMDMDQELISGDFYSLDAISEGDFNVKVASVNVSTPKNGAGSIEVLAIKNVLMSGVAAVKNKELMDMTLIYRADEVTSAGQTFKQPNIEISIDNLDVQAMQDLNALLSTASNAVDEAFFEQHEQEIFALVNKFLAKEPVVQLKDVSVITADGKIESTMKMTLNKDKFDMKNPMSVMAALNATAHAQGPEAFFAKLGLVQMINMYVEQGLLLRKAPNLETSVDFKEGKLTVNGKVFPM